MNAGARVIGRSSLGLAAAALLAGGCYEDATVPVVQVFLVTIENVSEPGTLEVERLEGVVPLSAGVHAVFTGADPLFVVGAAADAGTERLAEDGVTSVELELLEDAAGVIVSGEFGAPGGTDETAAIHPGEIATFAVTATPGERLQIELMFVQSNDWFYAFGAGGVALFDDDGPIDGELTGRLVLYDAGTEADTAPGTGPDQKPAQEPGAIDVGPPDPIPMIRPASGFPIPATNLVIRVNITPL